MYIIIVLGFLCECHDYKRDRESSRVLVKMLKRLFQKSRKLQSDVRSRLSKNLSKSSKVHDLIKNNATRKKSRHKTRVRFVQKLRRKPIFRTRNVNSWMGYVYNSCRDKHGKKYLKYLWFFSCNFPHGEYKALDTMFTLIIWHVSRTNHKVSDKKDHKNRLK